MNFLFIEQHPRFGGGSERMSLALCAYLHRKGHATHLLYEINGDMVPAYAEVTQSVTRSPVGPLAVRSPLSAVTSLRNLRRVVRSRGIEVAFTSQLGYVSLLGVARRVFGLRSVVHLGLALDFPSPVYRWAQAQIVAAVAPSDPMRAACLGIGWSADQLHVVPNGVDLERFKPSADPPAIRSQLGLPQDAAVITYLGRLVEEKGIFTLVRACSELRRTGRKFCLVVAGAAPGGERDALRSLAAEVGLGPGEFSLREPTTAPEHILAAADLAVVPSQWPEPFGLAAIEAMACGSVPIVSDAGILPQIVGETRTECIFRQGDVAGLAARMAHLIDNPNERGRLRGILLDRVRATFDMRICGAGYEAIFRSLVPTQ